MQRFNAHYWENGDSYRARILAEVTNQIKKGESKKKRQQKLKAHNAGIKGIATSLAKELRENPSALEQKMAQFLEAQGIRYDFQRIFYIENKQGSIYKFYIADFYLPLMSLIIETDGAFHDNQIKEDKIRTWRIQKHYPNIKILRWRWYDFDDLEKVHNLKEALKGKSAEEHFRSKRIKELKTFVWKQISVLYPKEVTPKDFVEKYRTIWSSVEARFLKGELDWEQISNNEMWTEFFNLWKLYFGNI